MIVVKAVTRSLGCPSTVKLCFSVSVNGDLKPHHPAEKPPTETIALQAGFVVEDRGCGDCCRFLKSDKGLRQGYHFCSFLSAGTRARPSLCDSQRTRVSTHTHPWPHTTLSGKPSPALNPHPSPAHSCVRAIGTRFSEETPRAKNTSSSSPLVYCCIVCGASDSWNTSTSEIGWYFGSVRRLTVGATQKEGASVVVVLVIRTKERNKRKRTTLLPFSTCV